MSEQLLLDLQPQKLEGFIPASANSRALEAILALNMVAVIGARLSGKSQIALASARQIGGRLLTNKEDLVEYLNSGDVAAIFLDDADKLGDEDALFHLYNHQKSHGARLILFASENKSKWGIKLPDLGSRLGTIQEVDILQPDDGLVVGLLVKWLYERGLQPRPKLIDYVVKRIERDYERVYEFVSEIDRRVAQGGERPTRKLAKEILGIAE